MNLQASMVRLLEAANIPTPHALAVAEAIDLQIESSDLLTAKAFREGIAGLEKRMDGFDGRFRELDMSIDHKISHAENRNFLKMATLGLSATAIIISAVLFMVTHLRA